MSDSPTDGAETSGDRPDPPRPGSSPPKPRPDQERDSTQQLAHTEQRLAPTGPAEPVKARLGLMESVLALLVGGSRRTTVGMALAAAAAVTAVVSIPLIYKAMSSDAPHVTAPESLVGRRVDAGTPFVINGAELSGSVNIQFIARNVTATAFNVAPSGSQTPSSVVIETIDGSGPTFDFMTDDLGEAVPFDTTELPDGDYDLFVTATLENGEHAKTVAQFSVRNR